MDERVIKSLDEEIRRYQGLVEQASREVRAGNTRMAPMLEGYANHRDSLMVQKDALVAQRRSDHG